MAKAGMALVGIGLGSWGFYRLGSFLVGRCPRWPLALGLVLLITLVVAVVLPGNAGIWAELFGTAGCLPIYFQVLPSEFFQLTDQLPQLIVLALYLVFGVLVASLGPMVLLMLFGPLLEE